MKRDNWERWLALLMAVAMVFTSGMFATNQALRASDGDNVVRQQEMEDGVLLIDDAVDENAVADHSLADQPAPVDDSPLIQDAVEEAAGVPDAIPEAEGIQDAFSDEGEVAEEGEAADAVNEGEAADNTAEEAQPVESEVAFHVDDGASVRVNGADVTNASAKTSDGTITFVVDLAEGYELTAILVNGAASATQTGNAGEYRADISAATVIDVNTEMTAQTETTAQTEVQTETAAQAETELQSETAAQTETELQSETAAQAETELQSETAAQTETELQTESEAQAEVVTESEPESETRAEVATEVETENTTEFESEALSIDETETAETETEEVTEAVSEAEAEEVTEAVSEAEAEEITEAVGEVETEEITETVSEAEAEEITEAVSEAETEEVTEAVSEAETEEVTEAVAMPAQSFQGVTASGIRVNVSAAEGAFPEGTTMRVADVTEAATSQITDKAAENGIIEEEAEVQDAVSVDITFYDADGNEIEPAEGTVQVSIIPADALEGENFTVIHEKEDGSVEEVTGSNVTSQGVAFNAESFTVYTVVPTGNANVINKTNNEVTVKVGESIDIITDKTYAFDSYSAANSSYWSVTKGADNISYVVGSAQSEYEHYPALTITGEKAGDATVKFYKNKWTTETFTVHVEADAQETTELTLAYDANGGSFANQSDATVTVEAGESVTLPTADAVTRDGYNLVGWSTNDTADATVESAYSAAGSQYTVNDEGITLYAVWSEKDFFIEYTGATEKTTATLSANMTNAEAVFVIVEEISSTNKVTYGPYKYTEPVKIGLDGTKRYIIVYGKPYNNHLIIGLNADGAGKISPINSLSGTEANADPAIVAKLKEMGYVAGWGWTRYTGYSTGSVSFTLIGQQPEPTVHLVSDVTSGAKPGDVINVTATISPGTIDRTFIATLTEATIDINGNQKTLDVGAMTKNSDGSYTVSIPYTVTEADAVSGRISGSVDASFHYLFNLDKKATAISAATKITTEADIKADSDFFVVNIADQNQVSYLYQYKLADGADAAYKYTSIPSAVQGEPTDITEYYIGQKVTVSTTPAVGTTVHDAENHGTWTFGGWMYNGKKAASQVAMVEAGLSFVGLWTFTPDARYTVEYVGNAKGVSAVPTKATYVDGDTVRVGRSGGYDGELVTPERTGYIFQGWNTKSDGTGEVTYKDNETFTIGSNVTLYAQWKANTGTAYKVEHIGVSLKGEETILATENLSGNTDEQVQVTKKIFDDYYPIDTEAVNGKTYVSDTTGTISGDGKLVLKTYYVEKADWDVSVPHTEVKYDGQNHVVTDLDENSKTYTLDGKVYTISGLTVNGSGTFAGSYPVKITGVPKVLDADGNDATNRFKITTHDGTLIINKREVVITSGSASKEYDGSALTENSVTYSGDGFVSGQGVVINYTGSQTNVGNGVNTFDYTVRTGTSLTNYSITKAYGSLDVTNRDAKYRIVVEANSNSDVVKYDGQEHTVEGLVNSVYTIEGNEFTVTGLTASASGTEVGTYPVNITGTAVVTDANGVDVSDQFAVVTTAGTLTISQREVTLTSADAYRKYNGSPLTYDRVDVTGDGFVQGEGATYNVTGRRTLVGNQQNTFKYTLNDGTNAANYKITVVYGTLHVLDRDPKVPITISAQSDTVLYDGATHTINQAHVETRQIGMPDADGTIVTNTYTITGLTETAEGTDADSYTVALTGTLQILDENGNDVTKQFEPTLNPGTLTINPRTVNLASQSTSKQYDGSALTATVVSTTGNGFVTGEVSAVRATGEITNVGTATNEIAYTTGEGFKEENYIIKKNEGTLEVTQNRTAVEITAATASKTYDGSALTSNEVTATGLPKGFTVEATTDGSVTNVSQGVVTNNITSFIIKDAAGNNVTSAFANVTTSAGSLSISQKTVNLTSEGATKVYDGSPLTKEGVTGIGDFVTGEVTELNAIGTITNVGSTPNTIEIVVGTNYDVNNYDIHKNEGNLIVTQNANEIVVTANDATKIYDGTPLTNAGYEITGLPDGFTEDVTITGSVTDAGSADSVVSSVVIRRGNTDVTDQFGTITTHDGKLTVTQRNVTLTSKTVSRAYNGEALTSPEVTVGGDGFVEGEVTNLTATGTITEIGEVDNTITYTETSAFKAGNYSISTTTGKLSITANTAEITVTAKDASKVYDGQPLTEAGYVVSGLPSGYTLDVTVEGTITDAGTATNAVTAVAIKKGNVDVTNQFAPVKTNNGTLTVSKRTVTLQSAGISREYDGTELNSVGVTVGGDGFVDGEINNLKATGSVTKIGTATNTITYDEGTSFKAGNYQITKDEGTLEIKANTTAINVKAASQDKTYDGTPLTNGGYSVSSLNMDGYTVTATVSGTITNAGSADNTVTNVTIKKGEENVTDQFSGITTTNGTLTINPASVTVKANDQTKTYGANEPSYDATVTGLLNGDKITYSLDRADGENVTTAGYTITPSGEKTQGNYSVTYETGTLTITPASVVVKAINASKTYGAQDPADFEVEITGLQNNESEDLISYSVNRASGNNVGDYTITPSGDAVQGNYAVTYDTGTFTIGASDSLTVTGTSGEYDYDGTAHGVAASASVAEGTTISYSIDGGETWQTTAPTITNAGTITVDVKAENANYETATGSYTLTVKPAEVTVTAVDSGKVYGSAEPDLTATVTGTVGTDTVSYTVTRAQGSNAGDYTITAAGDADQGNYHVTFADGTFKISPKAITVTADPKTIVYGEAEPTLTATPDGLVDGDELDYTVTRKAGTDAGIYPITVSAGENVSPNYTVTYVGSSLKIDPKPITVTVDAKTKTYGEEDPGFTATASDLVGDDVLTYTFDRVGGEGAGNHEISVTATDGKGNYTYTYAKADLTIERKAVTVYANNASKTYGVTADPTLTAIVKDTADNVITDNSIRYTLKRADGEDADSYTITASGDEVQGNYDVEFVGGTFTIDPKTVTVTAANASKTYGEADPEFIATTSGTIGNDTVTYSVARGENGENAGTYAITPSGAERQGNYTVEYVDGTLTINPKSVTVTANDLTKTYGSADPEYTVTYDGLVQGDAINYIASREEGVNVGEYTITLDGAADQGNYTVKFETGTLTIEPKKVTVKAKDELKTFGAQDPDLEVVVTGTLNGDTIDYTVSREEGDTVGTYTITTDGETKQGNYTVAFENGTLTVADRDVKYAVTITGNSSADDASYIYDGTEKTVSGVDKTKVIIDGNTYTITGLEASASATDAGTYPVNVTGTAKVTDAKGNDVTDQFSVSVAPGTLNIKPREIVMTSASDSKTYDGEELTNKTVRVTGDGFVAGEGADVSVSGSQTIVGSSENKFSYTLTTGTKENNYKISTVNGTLKVVSRDEKPEIRLEGRTDSFVYDGTEHTVEGFSNTSITVNGKTYEISGISSSVTATDAGSYDAVIIGTAVIRDENGNDVTDQFDLNIVPAHMTIEKRPITLTSQSATKAYDGSALTAGGVDVTSGSFVGDDGEKIKVNVYGTVMGSGEEALNGFTISWGDVNENNYDVTYVFGTLTVANSEATETEEETAAIHNLAIHYVDTEGTTMANDWNAEYVVGTSFAIVSPVITGYTPDYTTVISPIGGMPARDLEVTVTYTRNTENAQNTQSIQTAQTTLDTQDAQTTQNGQSAQAAQGTQNANGSAAADVPFANNNGNAAGSLITDNGNAIGTVEAESREATGADLVSVDNIETPLGQIVLGNEGTDEEDVEIQLITVEDIETPLANIEIHLCNAAPFLMLILTLAALLLYAEDMKKQQKRLFELRRALKED